MQNIIDIMLEDFNNLEAPKFPNNQYDVNTLGSAYTDYANGINKTCDCYEDRVRELCAALPAIPANAVILNEDFPKYAIDGKFKVNAYKVINNAHFGKDFEDSKYILNKGLIDELNNYMHTDCGDITTFKSAMINDGLGCKKQLTADEVYKIANCTKANIYNTINLARSIGDIFKEYKQLNPCEYENHGRLFNYVIYLLNQLASIYLSFYNRYYQAAMNYTSPEDSDVNIAKAKLNMVQNDIEKVKAFQEKWKALHNGNPNMEFNRKLDILNEKAKAREEYLKLCNEASVVITSENVAKYRANLEAVIKDIREFYSTYEYKELLEPRYKHIDKMDDYVRGALKRQYALRIPLYKVTKASGITKMKIKNDFIPRVSKVVDKYKEFIILAPDFGTESGDIFIYLTLREPHGDKEDMKTRANSTDPNIQNEAASDPRTEYDIIKSGRYYKAIHLPTNTDLGNEDSMEEAEYDIKTDIRERQEKAAKNETSCMCESDGSHSAEWNKLNTQKKALLEKKHVLESKYNKDSEDFWKVRSEDLAANNKDISALDDDIAKIEYQMQALNEEALSQEERDKLDPSDFGIPEIKGYPLNDENHIRKAIQFFNYCKSEYKQTLAKNIEKKVVANDLVGKVTVGEKHPGRKYFHDWMITGRNPVCKKDADTYHIFVDGKEVDRGVLPKKSMNESTLDFIVDPVTGQLYI